MGVLTELIPEPETVTVRGKELKIRGLYAEELIKGLQRFPELVKLFDQRDANVLKILADTPGAMAAAIVAAVEDKFGDEQAEAEARRIPVDTQMELVQIILQLTFRDGFGPFGARLAAMIGVSPAAPNGSGTPMNSPRQFQTLRRKAGSHATKS